MTPRRDWFIPHSFKRINPPRLVHFGDESTVPVIGIGNVVLHQTINGETFKVIVHNVLFVPAFTLTLLSVRRFNNAGFFSTFKGKKCTVKSTASDETIL
ncbi:hypothetical protein B0H34DRAFT_625598, partial [Crassisporium funariophilum]